MRIGMIVQVTYHPCWARDSTWRLVTMGADARSLSRVVLDVNTVEVTAEQRRVQCMSEVLLMGK